MVKKVPVICSCLLLLVFTTGIASAQISYCKDFLEPGNEDGSLKTFDEEWTLEQNETVEMNIWINDIPESQLLTAGFFIEFDPALINITNVVPNDINNGGPWDAVGEKQNFEVAPGQWFLALVNFGCVESDGDGDILLGKATFQSQSSGSTAIIITTIPSFDTLTGCSEPSTNYDLQIMPNTVTINKGNGTSSTTTGPGTTTSTSPSTTTSAESSTTTTEPSSNTWKLAYAMVWEQDSEQKVSLLRTFRNELVDRNEVVRNYVSLLYQHSSEVAGVFIKHPLLCLETRKLVEALLPSIGSFLETEKLVLTANQKDRVESFLNHFELKVTPELKGIIQDFRKDLRDGRLFFTVS
jgi:hypothetical protein